MDLFKFKGNATTPFQEGSAVSDATSVTWIERYRDYGEFQLEAPVSSGLKAYLPIGTFVSHLDTAEVMVVENHEITDKDSEEDEIIISGRSLDAYLAERVVGSNYSYPQSSVPRYNLAAGHLVDQIVTMINHHIRPSSLVDDDDELTRVQAIAAMAGTGSQELREIETGLLSARVLELMELGDFGLKTIRPGANSPLSSETDVAFQIHEGADLSSRVSFSFEAGDLSSGKYLWTSKKLKTSALVVGKWVQTVVHGSESGFDRRVMYVTANDLDDYLDVNPTGATRTKILNDMTLRGQQALAAQKNVAIASVEVSPNSATHRYRQDYDIGDVVAVEGNYNSETTMRVIEHVEIEDATGVTSYPTLSLI